MKYCPAMLLLYYMRRAYDWGGQESWTLYLLRVVVVTVVTSVAIVPKSSRSESETVA